MNWYFKKNHLRVQSISMYSGWGASRVDAGKLTYRCWKTTCNADKQRSGAFYMRQSADEKSCFCKWLQPRHEDAIFKVLATLEHEENWD